MGFPEFCQLFQLINRTQGGGPWAPVIYSQSVRSTGDNWDLQLASEVEGGLVGRSLLPVESDSVSGWTVLESS